MRLVMLGTGPFAVPTLRALAAAGHDVALVARPPRGRQPEASPMRRAGESLGFEVWSPDSVNTSESQARLAALQPDLLVVCDYGEILRPETLATARLGGINLHGSLLPKYRGAAPVQWAILRGERETGNSVIQMTPGLDAGPCLGQQRTGSTLTKTPTTRRGSLTWALVPCRVIGQPPGRPALQDRAGLKRRAQRGRNDRLSRPRHKDQASAGAVPQAHSPGGRHPGLNVDCVAVARDRSRHVVTREAAIATAPSSPRRRRARFLKVTAGKRAMSASEFLRGNRIRVGDRLGLTIG
jgi:hypothetical protein